jgi:hypothetical protein
MRIERHWVGIVSSISFLSREPIYDLLHAAMALQTYPKETATHLALSALSSLPTNVPPTEESLRAAVQNIIGQDVELPDELHNAVGEM